MPHSPSMLPQDPLLRFYLGQVFEDADAALAVLPPEMRGQIRDALTRREEIGGPRDIWGNWDFSFSRGHREGLTYFPWVDELLLRKVDLTRRSLWPDGKPFALCITHDVDLLSGFPSFPGRIDKLLALAGNPDTGAGPREYAMMLAGILKGTAQALAGRVDPFDFHDMVGFEDSLGFKSTFHFIAEHKGMPHVWDCFYRFGEKTRWDGRPMEVRQVMRELHRAGWDVGVHGSYRSALVPGLLRNEKEQIDEAVGALTVSTRQHYLHFEASATPAIQAGAGLLADSTQGFNRDVGFRAGTAFPYPLLSATGDVLDLVEIPQHIMDTSLFSESALGLPEELALAHSLALMDRVERIGGILTLNWHPLYWNIRPMWRRVFEEILREARRRNAYGCSMRDALGRCHSHPTR
jgi:hypothetical protein